MSLIDKLNEAEKKRKKAGIATPAQKAADFVKSAAQFGMAMAGPDASEELIAKRMKICDECDLTDESGDRLYREVKGGRHACGALRTSRLMRVSRESGCGCVLERKWKKEKSTCPSEKW